MPKIIDLDKLQFPDCPLRPMPEKGPKSAWADGMQYEDGWNDCLDAIEGRTDDG